MKHDRRPLRLMAVLLLWAVPAVSLGLAQSVHAQDDDERKVPNMSMEVHDKLAKIHELIEAEEYEEAEKELQRLLDRTRRYNGLEIAQIHRMMALIKLDQELYEESIYHFEQVLAQVPNISVGMELATMYTVSQLYFQIEQPLKSLEIMNRWMAMTEEPPASAHFWMANIHYLLEDYLKAAESAETAVALRRADPESPPVALKWWDFLRAVQFQAENYPRCIEILELLVEIHPTRDYWHQLVGMYNHVENEYNVVGALESGSVGEYWDEEKYVLQYAKTLMGKDAYIRAAKILQQAFDDGMIEENLDNWNTLGQAYMASFEFEKATVVFTNASEYAEDGEIDDRLASLYFQLDMLPQCEAAARSALERGGLKRPYDTRRTLGICLFNAEEYDESREVFQDLRRDARRADDDDTEGIANDWLKFIRQQLELIAYIEDA